MAGLTTSQRDQYRGQGYYFPVRVFGRRETGEFRRAFENYLKRNGDEWRALPPRDRMLFKQTHLLLNWVCRMVADARLLDAVEAILGPNVLVWGSDWFPKWPEEKAYVSWHQDATYWGLDPPNAVTAWIALTESTSENGCMRVIPGSHNGLILPQRETYARENILSRGQEIAVEVDESKAVDLVLQPGEMSLHHIKIVHGSNANPSRRPRIGLAVRYISPEVRQTGPERDIVLLARGKDECGHFEIVGPPRGESLWQESALHAEALKRKAKNIMPEDYIGPMIRQAEP